MTVRMTDIVDTDAMARMIRDKYIMVRPNENNDHMAILCYSSKAQWNGVWTRETLTARGLIATTDRAWPDKDHVDDMRKALDAATIMSRGMPKFFTLEQANSEYGSVKLMDDDENIIVEDAPVIDENAPAIISDKLDGSLGVAYVANDGLIALSSKGSFSVPECLTGTECLRKNHDGRGMAEEFNRGNDMTPLFEVIIRDSEMDELRRHVCSYDYTDPVFIGMIDNRTGRWEPAVKHMDYARKYGLRTPWSETGTLRTAMELPDLDDHEGVVVTISNDDGSQTMLKVKHPRFLTLQALKNRSHKQEITRWLRSLTFDDLRAMDSPDDIPLDSIMGVDYTDIKWSGSNVTERAKDMIWRKYVSRLREGMAGLDPQPDGKARLEQAVKGNRQWRKLLNELHYYAPVRR